MEIRYDPEVDILVVNLGDLRRSLGAAEIAPGVYLDRDEHDTVLGLEILDASKRYPMDLLLKHPPNYDEPISLADVAPTLNTTPQALQKAISRGRLGGQKVGKTWTTTISAVTEYVNGRSTRGRKAKLRAPETEAPDSAKAMKKLE